MYSCEPIYVPSLRFDPGGGVRYVVFINCLSSLTIFDDLNFTMRVFALAVFSGYSRVKRNLFPVGLGGKFRILGGYGFSFAVEYAYFSIGTVVGAFRLVLIVEFHTRWT